MSSSPLNFEKLLSENTNTSKTSTLSTQFHTIKTYDKKLFDSNFFLSIISSCEHIKKNWQILKTEYLQNIEIFPILLNINEQISKEFLNNNLNERKVSQHQH
jgi:hypothetical protein